MGQILKKKFTGPMVWKGSELAKDRSWIHQLSNDEVAALDEAVSKIKALGKTYPNFDGAVKSPN